MLVWCTLWSCRPRRGMSSFSPPRSRGRNTEPADVAVAARGRVGPVVTGSEDDAGSVEVTGAEEWAGSGVEIVASPSPAASSASEDVELGMGEAGAATPAPKSGVAALLDRAVAAFASPSSPRSVRSSQASALAVHSSSEPHVDVRVLVLYTGGTIGMADLGRGFYEPQPGMLPREMSKLRALQDPAMPPGFMPLSASGRRIKYEVIEYDTLIDSSNALPSDWARMARDISNHYSTHDAFVVLHGTDTMAFTASALSFMLKNLAKTVIVTGSQIPMSVVRNDGESNIIGALTIAGNCIVPEVCLYFSNKLLRGNRSTKSDASALDAFSSPNIPPLGTVGISVSIDFSRVLRMPTGPFALDTRFDSEVVVFTLHPAFKASHLRTALQPPVRGCILLTYGAGNGPDENLEFLQVVSDATKRGVVIVNVTQCAKGVVSVHYATGAALAEAGAVAGEDMTLEAALAKINCLLGRDLPPEEVRRRMGQSLAGELTPPPRADSGRSALASKSFLSSVYRSLVGTGEVPSGTAGLDSIRHVVGPSLLCAAAAGGHVETLREVVETGCAEVDTVDHDGRTALHLGAAEGQVTVVEFLLSAGAPVDCQDRWGNTPLTEALAGSGRDHARCADLLRKAGATMTSAKGIRDLTTAAWEGKVEVVEKLIAHGVSTHSFGPDKRTPLHHAAAGGHLGVVKVLLANDAEVNAVDMKGQTPLALARLGGHPRAAEALAQAGGALPPGFLAHVSVAVDPVEGDAKAVSASSSASVSPRGPGFGPTRASGSGSESGSGSGAGAGAGAGASVALRGTSVGALRKKGAPGKLTRLQSERSLLAASQYKARRLPGRQPPAAERLRMRQAARARGRWGNIGRVVRQKGGATAGDGAGPQLMVGAAARVADKGADRKRRKKNGGSNRARNAERKLDRPAVMGVRASRDVDAGGLAKSRSLPEIGRGGRSDAGVGPGAAPGRAAGRLRQSGRSPPRRKAHPKGPNGPVELSLKSFG